MNFHSRLIELSKKDYFTNDECIEIVKKVHKSNLAFGPLLLDAVIALRSRGKLMNNNSKYQILTAALEAATLLKRWNIVEAIERVFFRTFDKDRKVLISHAHVFKSINLPSHSEKYSKKLMADNLADDQAIKNTISLVKFTPNHSKDVVEELNAYLEQNPGDKEAWLDLADTYMKFFEFQKALFCYEEVLLLVPDNIHIITRIAEICYTIGKADNLVAAKKYFSFVLTFQQTNLRALWGLKNTLKALSQVNTLSAEDKAINKELLELIEKKIKEVYSSKDMSAYTQ